MQLNFYIAHSDFKNDLRREIELSKDLKWVADHGDGFLVEGPPIRMSFAQNHWTNCQKISIESIGSAAKALKTRGKNWVSYKPKFARRASLIEDQVHRYSPPKLQFPTNYQLLIPNAWTLLSETEILYSLSTDSVFPNGEAQFIETKAAPSRAYLKLWELFLKLGKSPKAGEKCLDLGSHPGGWTWVLDQIGCDIISVDRAPLHESLQKKTNIKNIVGDAFSVSPETTGSLDWLFSDLICYPEKLLELVHRWQNTGSVKNFVCTIKFQGETDFETMEKFKKIPGSEIHHLSVNKHEVTWVLIRP